MQAETQYNGHIEPSKLVEYQRERPTGTFQGADECSMADKVLCSKLAADRTSLIAPLLCEIRVSPARKEVEFVVHALPMTDQDK